MQLLYLVCEVLKLTKKDQDVKKSEPQPGVPKKHPKC